MWNRINKNVGLPLALLVLLLIYVCVYEPKSKETQLVHAVEEIQRDVSTMAQLLRRGTPLGNLAVAASGGGGGGGSEGGEATGVARFQVAPPRQEPSGSTPKPVEFQRWNANPEGQSAQPADLVWCGAAKPEVFEKRKTKDEIAYDMFFHATSPYYDVIGYPKATEWRLELQQRNADGRWPSHLMLGLQNWDSQYQHGTEEANQRVARRGMIRIAFPTVPRTGSTWLRKLIEYSTGLATASVFNEDDIQFNKDFDERINAFVSSGPCGKHRNWMQGRKVGVMDEEPGCPRQVRPPQNDEAAIVKSHLPFWPDFYREDMVEQNNVAFTILLVRNPFDAYGSWRKYSREIFREYVPKWAGHLLHYLLRPEIPLYVIRYEDLILDPAKELRLLFQALPGGWDVNSAHIDAAINYANQPHDFQATCFRDQALLVNKEYVMVHSHYNHILRMLGYEFSQLTE